MKKLILIATLLCLSLPILAQDLPGNALLFSRNQPVGSARMQGIGGPKSSLGGDYSSALINPAGLGMYNRNEVTITPSLMFVNSTSQYYGTSAEKESRSAFSIPGFSVVLNWPSQRDHGFLGGSLSLSLTRTNDFHQDFRYQGTNDQNSIIDYFIQNAFENNVLPDDMLDGDPPGDYFYTLTALGYRNYLFEYEDSPDFTGYYTVLDFSRVRQSEVSERKGSQNQWNISYGANFDDKFFAGISLGISSFRYKQSQVFREDNYDYVGDAPEAMSDLTITENFDIRGSGINLSLGTIFRPTDFLQLGLSFTTPTYYDITDKYRPSVETNWNNFQYYDDLVLNNVYVEFPEEQLYEYNLTTPLRLNGGVTFIQKFGFISANIEYVNYPKAKYSSDIAGEFEVDNGYIKSDFRDVLNYSLGMEFRQNIMRYRLGGSYLSVPFNESRLDGSVLMLAAGLGVRLEQFFIDLAANHSMTDVKRVPYYTLVGNADPEATNKYRNTRYVLTVGFTF
jgi:hypothetical protein